MMCGGKHHCLRLRNSTTPTRSRSILQSLAPLRRVNELLSGVREASHDASIGECAAAPSGWFATDESLPSRSRPRATTCRDRRRRTAGSAIAAYK